MAYAAASLSRLTKTFSVFPQPSIISDAKTALLKYLMKKWDKKQKKIKVERKNQEEKEEEKAKKVQMLIFFGWF